MTCLKYFMSPSVDADFLQKPFLFLRSQKHCFKEVTFFLRSFNIFSLLYCAVDLDIQIIKPAICTSVCSKIFTL